MKKSIVWLASYPKSGNTWARIFLANYMMNQTEPVPINQVHRFGIGDTIEKTYRMVGGQTADLSSIDVTLALRPKVLRGIVANNADVNLVKTHNIRSQAFGHELIPQQLTRSAVYIMRNPLDVVISYARHFGKTLEETVEAIGRSDNASPGGPGVVHQFLGSWSEHVQSWTSQAPYPQITLRYEDMMDDPRATFAKLVDHFGVPLDDERLDRAIRFSSFDEVSKQEEKTGFVEASDKTDKFFAKGTAGQWREELAPKLIKRVKKDHRKVMQKYGYLE